MNRFTLFSLFLLFSFFSGCTGLKLDYGDPAAQFVEEDVATKGKDFLSKIITVKGTVTKVDVSDPKAAKVFLQHGIQCNLGKLTRMAESCQVGETVYVDGKLTVCEEGNIILDPASKRDPNAKFEPK